jgi:hypothetical protein
MVAKIGDLRVGAEFTVDKNQAAAIGFSMHTAPEKLVIDQINGDPKFPDSVRVVYTRGSEREVTICVESALPVLTLCETINNQAHAATQAAQPQES